MRELEIPRGDLAEIAKLALGDGGGRNNPVLITRQAQVMEVLEKAW